MKPTVGRIIHVFYAGDCINKKPYAGIIVQQWIGTRYPFIGPYMKVRVLFPEGKSDEELNFPCTVGAEDNSGFYVWNWPKRED